MCRRVWPAQTAAHGQGVTPNQGTGSAQPFQVQMEIQRILQPGSHHRLSAQARLWMVVLRRKGRKFVGGGWRSDCRRRQEFISGSSSLVSSSSSSALPQRRWCCLREDWSWDIYFFHSGRMFLLWGSGEKPRWKKSWRKKEEWGSCCMFQQLP